jgi:UDP-N-acetylglucosamine--N-acetylmuramyl-(pentapeptide) pyrophosphoryl-undecaprenol N-acetylglucosamine transferase
MKRVAKVYPFYHEMERLYAAADLVIARSGAASLAEIIHWSLPSFLIPFPFAADKHQTANAQILVKEGAALMMEEADCKPEVLVREIENILNDGDYRKKMVEATKRLQSKDSHKKLANLVEEIAKKN